MAMSTVYGSGRWIAHPKFTLDLACRADGAINLQLYRRLVSLIVSGHWGEGTRLPSSRTLAADVGVSRTTASLALDRLVSEGWAIARPRSGLFVARSVERPAVRDSEDRQSSSSSPVPFELSQGAVDCFPHARWSKLQSRVWAAQVPDALYEPNAAGDHGLRSSLVRHLMVTRGIHCSADDIFLVPSTRAALALAARILADEVSTCRDRGSRLRAGRRSARRGWIEHRGHSASTAPD